MQHLRLLYGDNCLDHQEEISRSTKQHDRIGCWALSAPFEVSPDIPMDNLFHPSTLLSFSLSHSVCFPQRATTAQGWLCVASSLALSDSVCFKHSFPALPAPSSKVIFYSKLVIWSLRIRVITTSQRFWREAELCLLLELRLLFPASHSLFCWLSLNLQQKAVIMEGTNQRERAIL